MEPNQLKEMIHLIRQTEFSLKNTYTEIFTPSEESFKQAMRSVVAKTGIKKGDILTVDNITTKRPFLDGNIPAKDFEWVLGKIADKDYNEDDFI
jgi:sialic acid synthase SpsE